MLWKILADAVTGFQLLLIGFFVVSAVLLALGVFQGHRKWQFSYYGFAGLVAFLWVASLTKVLKSCSLTELEYMLRRLYDPSESWMRTRSLVGTIILNLTGIEVPEFTFTIGAGILTVMMIIALVIRR